MRLSRLIALALLGAASAVVSAQPFDPSLFSDAKWRLVGPFRGGWATCAEGVPDAPETYYFGAAAGGVWKTESAGRTWTPVFDREGSASIGALAVAPSNKDVVWVGTGQIQARYDVASGDGVYRSDDGGKSWRHAGLRETRAIGRILVDPGNPDVAVVAALGHMYGPNRERGIYRTEDGGRTWQQTLSVSEDSGGADLARDPENPSVLYASMWQGRNYPWLSYFEPMAGPGSGIYKSTDAGRSWKRLSGGGWPSQSVGRIGLAAAAGGRVWALVDAPGEAGAPGATAGQTIAGLYRSDDGGATWTRANATPGLASSYMNRVTVDPRQRDTVYVTGQTIRRSDDAGKTFTFFRGAPGGDDFHFLWINPKRPEYMVAAADQGTIVTVDGGKTWSDWYNQPTGQFYHVETDDRFPYWLYSGQQDSGTAGTTSRSDYGSITFRDWQPVGGEERGWDVPDPRDPLIVYGSGLGGTITRWDARTAQVRNISPSTESTYGRRPVPGVYRWAWCFPLAVGRKAPYPLYAGSQYLLRSLDGGESWEKASPDLSGADENATGCPTAGNPTPEVAKRCGYGVIWTIEISPRDDAEIWVGTDDGTIRLTRDAGKTWKDVTPKGLPAWSKISSVDASPLEAGVAYAAVDRHRADDFTPHVYRTRDFGASWQEISNGLPASRFVTVVRADTVKRGLLYAGTDGGAQVSFDDGAHWQALQSGLPTAWVGDLQVHGKDLVAATQGRGLWVLDDVTPLRQISAAVASAPATLFAPGAAVRVRANMNRDTPLPPEVPAAPNPPAGAVLDYVLTRPAKSVRIEILDARGETVRSYATDAPEEKPRARQYFTDRYIHPQGPPPSTPGHHRYVWDLRYTRPPADQYDYTISAVAGEDAPLEPRGPLVLPGGYKVRLTVDGASQEQPLVVSMDPRVSVAPAVLSETQALQREVVAAMRASYDALVKVRGLRKSIAEAREKAAAGGGAALKSLDDADARARHIESGDGQAGGRRRAGGGLAGANGGLAAILTALDGADAPPTAPQRAAAQRLRGEVDALVAEWRELETTIPKLNVRLRAAGVPEVRAVAAPPDGDSDSRSGVEIE